MDLSLELSSSLRDLVDSIGAGDGTLTESFAALDEDLRAAVAAYQGLRLTLVLDGWPVTLTAFADLGATRPATSLRLALAALGPEFGPESRIVIYAGRPGALVDLAADVRHLRRSGPGPAGTPAPDPGHGRGAGDPRVLLDADLPPESVVSGLSGLAEYATIHRAVGVLIGRGHPPDHAFATLRRAAVDANLTVLEYAARLLREETDR